MLNKVYKEILENYERYELLNNGYYMENCDGGELYRDNENNEFIEIGFNEIDDVIRINILKEL